MICPENQHFVRLSINVHRFLQKRFSFGPGLCGDVSGKRSGIHYGPRGLQAFITLARVGVALRKASMRIPPVLPSAPKKYEYVGAVQEQYFDYPYGGLVASIGSYTNHYKFTGKERDSETGLDMFGARYYGSGLGRFMTPDCKELQECRRKVGS